MTLKPPMDDLMQTCVEILHKNPPRLDRQLQIEASIVAFNGDPVETIGLLHAVGAAIKNRHGDNAVDFLQCLDEAEEALAELERTLCAYEVDEMDLSRDAAIAESER